MDELLRHDDLSGPPVVGVGASAVPVSHGNDGEAMVAGHAYVAPAAVHLSIREGRLSLDAGARENGARPAIDVLFRSVAQGYGRRGAGVVLSGLLDDGTAGLAAIVACGGTAFVQDPRDASFGDMPRNARDGVDSATMGTAEELAMAVGAFAARARDVAAGGPPLDEDVRGSDFSCPACGGVLAEVESGGVLRYRCHTGHAYSTRSLFADQERALETALWTALRAIEERIALSRRLASCSRESGHGEAARRFAEQASQAEDRAGIVRRALGDYRVAQRAAAGAGQPDR